jgi:FtsP/CotA-like multicopper oxidase with cupredoxin domain
MTSALVRLAFGLLVHVVVAACTRHYDFTVTWEDGAPNGHVRKMFKINGQFPGPTIKLHEGDDVVVTVKNLSPKNTTLHFHGMSQQPVTP